MLATYKLTDNKPQPLLRVKLSVGREGMLDIALAGAGQLAFVSADPIVRFYNLQSDDNYVRPPPTAADRRRACMHARLAVLSGRRNPRQSTPAKPRTPGGLPDGNS